MPGGRDEVAKTAFALPFSGAVPRRARPERKLTLPVGVPAEPDVIVAVKVTDCPSVEGFGDEASAVEVEAPDAALTTWERAEELLGLWPGSPE